MNNLKEVSKKKNYTEILKEVSDEKPVFLTKNEKCEYVILSIGDYNKLTATQILMGELEKGEGSTQDENWYEAENVEKILKIK